MKKIEEIIIRLVPLFFWMVKIMSVLILGFILFVFFSASTEDKWWLFMLWMPILVIAVVGYVVREIMHNKRKNKK